jgi:NAD(P)-dependent dehydrogenase (short-subunit alcohol dehydrogenase family)
MNMIWFTAEDLDLFSAASNDKNPLHLSEEYARLTPYGSRVVFGVFNALTALAAVPDRPGRVLSSIELEFFDTALLGVNYAVEIHEDDEAHTTLHVMDGVRPILDGVLSFSSGSVAGWQGGSWPQHRSEPADLSLAHVQVGRKASGQYAPHEQAFESLYSRLFSKSWFGRRHAAALLWASYLIGMEIPGRRALFSRLSIDFESSRPVIAPFMYEANTKAVSPLGEVNIEASLSSAGSVWATVNLSAYVREDVPPITLSSVEELVGRGDSLSGKVALVTGGSRGLGRAMVHALTLHGCTTILNFVRNRGLAEQVRDSASAAPGKVVLEPGNAGDLHWCKELSERILEQFGRLDFLICNASPPLLPLWLDAPSAVRINEFLRASVALASSPMIAFLPHLAARKGWNVLVSSVAATQPHPHFPHYTTAKCAAEAILRSAATEYRDVSSLIVRPARMLTDLTNTPLGRRGAIRAERVASAVVNRLRKEPCRGKVEILEGFNGADTP